LLQKGVVIALAAPPLPWAVGELVGVHRLPRQVERFLA
jgi:hypothetical protein